jgi:hypothetical protein
MEIPIEDVVRELVALLGATTVAVVGGVKETRAVTQWLSGRAPQRPHVLRFALQLGSMIANQGTNEIARAWFHGSNPQLGDAIPMMLLRDGELRDIQSPLLAAARSFAARA